MVLLSSARDLLRLPARISGVRRASLPLLAIVVFTTASAAGALAPTGIRADSAATASLYGIGRQGLVGVDQLTLRARRGRALSLAGHTFGWSFSPDRSELAIGSDGSAEVRLVDLRRWRVLGDVKVRVGGRGSVLGTAWAGSGRVLAAVVSPGCCGLGDTTVAAIDAQKQGLVWQRRLGGSLQAGARFRRSLVLILGPSGRSVGPSRLIIVRPDGQVRSARLDQIRSGFGRDSAQRPGPFVSDIWDPGLAIDPAGARALVVQAGEPVAEVDLRSLRVRYHNLAEPISLLGRLHDWVEPKAEAKADEGPSRQALWLGRGLLAVTGFDGHAGLDGHGKQAEWQTPAGLKLIDTRTWSVRTLDPQATNAILARNALVAFGILWDSRDQKVSGGGLTVYNLDGSRRFHLYGGKPISAVQALGSRILVGRADGTWALLDIRNGHQVRSVDLRLEPLAGDQPFWY